ncbi:hypothetical protein [uncultured Anaerococcus sp.]|uniref:hypothetical protein n=1 Tax=uncultured Anaerococcus sp. TaxID=293428 RepID=UPI0026220E85|nr:hypothetical protein [uncultured Anaerococcus sp.]
MKILKKIALSLLAANLAFLGLGQANVREVYAAESQNTDIKYDIQKQNLLLAVTDSVNVQSTEAYASYVSDNARAVYQQAVADGRAVLEKGDAATYEELNIATSKIQNAKLALKNEADKSIQNIKLREAVERNKIRISAARLLLETAPKKVASIKGQLLNLIKESEALIKAAEAIL